MAQAAPEACSFLPVPAPWCWGSCRRLGEQASSCVPGTLAHSVGEGPRAAHRQEMSSAAEENAQRANSWCRHTSLGRAVLLLLWATKSAANDILKTTDNAPHVSTTGSRTGIATCASWLVMKSQSSPDSQHTQWALSQKSSSAFQGRASSCPSQVCICIVMPMMTHRSLFFCRCTGLYVYMTPNWRQTPSLRSEGLYLMFVVRTGVKNVQEIPYFLKISSLRTESWARAEAKVYFLKIGARWNANSPKCCMFEYVHED